MNKQLGIMWDASITGRAGDINKAVEVLKNISGQDMIAVNPKNRDTIELPEGLPLNILMIANKIADLRDSSGALASRFTFLKTTQDFIGQEDPSMEQHVIKHELPGILNLIMAAPDTIIEHPTSGIMGQEFVEMSSPCTAFANQCCRVGSLGFYIPTNILWAYYKDWCEQYNHKPPSAQKFKIEFGAAIRGVKRYRPQLNDEQLALMDSEHCLSSRPGPKMRVSDRPHCYKGVDMLEELKGVWAGEKQGHENQF